MSTRLTLRALGLVLAALAPATLGAATFTVDRTNDFGVGSLRWAIGQANATPEHDFIHFAIPGSDTRVIAVQALLPSLAHPVTIDATTQPGWSGAPRVRLDGGNLPDLHTGLNLSGGGATIRGLQVVRFGAGIRVPSSGNLIQGNYIGTDGNAALGNTGWGIEISGSNNTVGGAGAGERNVISGNGAKGVFLGQAAAGNHLRGNHIGTNAAGTVPVPNGGDGLRILGDGNTIGGSFPGAGNLISGNQGDGVTLDPEATGNTLRGNRIGTNAAGTGALPNHGGGISLHGSSNVIGGSTAGSGNLISGNLYDGIFAWTGAVGNEIQGNRIGTNAIGTGAIGNLGYGIRVLAGHDNLIGGTESGAGNLISGNIRGVSLEGDSYATTFQGNVVGLDAAATAELANQGSGIEIWTPDNLIGGDLPGAGNIIAGNDYYGIVLTGGAASGNRIEGNWIGTNPAGAGRGNGYMGVLISQASGNVIGGIGPGAGNVIAHNGYLGVYVWSGEGNAILGNSIHGNELLGIDVDPQGPAPNDPGDFDGGANRGQNHPVVTAAGLDGGMLEIQGFLRSRPHTEYRIELFSNGSFDATGIGEGEHFLGAVEVATDASGHAPFTASLPAAAGGAFVTATATDPGGNTSELSPAIALGPPQPGQVQIWRDLLLSYEGVPGLEIAVVRSHGAAGTIAVDVATVDGSATAPDDYGSVATTLTFAPGEMIRTVFVPLVTDGLVEGDETWRLQLSNSAGGAVLGPLSDVLAWLFDGSLQWPLYSVGDAQAPEGDGAPNLLTFTVTLSPTDHAVPIDWWTLDGTAKAGEDYVESSGQLLFQPGDSDQSFTVEVLGDLAEEEDESFFVRVVAQGQSVVWDGEGEGRIHDDDGALPTLVFSDGFETGDTSAWSSIQGSP